MTALYHDAQRRLQDQFDTRRLADRIEERLVHDHLDEDNVAFITARDMFFLATVDPEGRPNCSYKGGDPGFVRVVDERTLAFPVYDGNGMFLSLGNIRAHAKVGMLFIDFDDPLRAEMTGATLVVRVRTTQVFPNCSRYIHRMQLVERSKFVPKNNV